jgi:hypothetical protein
MNVSDIQDITFGNLDVQTITLGNLTIWTRGGGGGGGDVQLSISPSSLNVSSAYSSNIIQVTSDDDTWDCESNVMWMTAERTSDTGASVTIYANTGSTASRSGVVRFKVDDVTYATLSVSQQGAAVQPFPSGWDIIDVDGDWALAWRETNNVYTFAVLYRYTDRNPSTISVSYEIEFYYDDDGSEEYAEIMGDTLIEDDDNTFSYGGQTYYGRMVGYESNVYEDTISAVDFDVT